MFKKPLKEWAKSLARQFDKPQTYGSALEYYIVSKNPQNAGDIDRLTREFERKQDEFVWMRGL